jgi:large subunit ribosomal protein L7/L12
MTKEEIEKLADALVEASTKDLIELKTVLKEKYGLEPAVSTIIEQKETEKEEIIEEKTSFDVILKSFSLETSKKLGAIRLVKSVTGLDLQSSKSLLETAPTKLKEGISKIEAEDIKTQFIALDAEIEII